MTDSAALQLALTWYRPDEASPVEIDAAAAVVGETLGTRLTWLDVVGDDARTHRRARRVGAIERLMSRTTRDRMSSVLAFAKARGRPDNPPASLEVTRMTSASGSPYALHVTHDLTDDAVAGVPELCEGVAALGDWHSGIGTIQPIVNHRLVFGQLTALVLADTAPLYAAFKNVCARFAADPSAFRAVASGGAARSVLRWNALDAALADRVARVLSVAGLGGLGTWLHYPNGALWTVETRADRLRAADALHAAGLMHDPMFLDPEDIDVTTAASPF